MSTERTDQHTDHGAGHPAGHCADPGADAGTGRVDRSGTDRPDPAADRSTGNVTYLPACRPPTGVDRSGPAGGAGGGAIEPAGEVLDAELVDEDVYRAAQRTRALARYAGYRRDLVVAAQWSRRAATHDRTKAAVKAVVRHGLYVPVGVGVVARRVWEAHTNSRYERLLRAAEVAGDWDRLAEWEQRAELARERRHRRAMDWVRAPWQLARAVAAFTVTGVAVLLVGGVLLAIASKDARRVLDPINGFLTLVEWTAWAVTVAWGPLVLVAPWLGVLWLWHEGRRRGSVPSWVATASAADVDVSIDETSIARALGALRVPAITDYLKKGLPLQFLTPARVDGRGTHAVLRLPAGVTAEKIARRRADLAAGLHRLAKEVWPTTGGEAGVLDLWVADKGALAEGAGPYPLLPAGLVDVFKGVPFGKTLRGDPVTAPVMERNTITGGMPGQGKSSADRVLMAGAALDPTAELRIWVPDANFDFEVFRPRCSRYVMGAEDERIAEILEHLRELHAEVQRRGELLVRHETPAVTRQLANRGIGLHPLVCLLEEAHVAIQHPDHGKDVAKLLVDIVRLGRKRGIHLIVSTQAPTKDSMPRDVTRNCSNGIAFAVGDHVANDALLGQGAYTAGHRATELIPGTDRGTAVVKGFSGERSDIVQVYFLDVTKGNDQVTPIIDRAMAAIDDRGRGLPGHQHPTPATAPARDLLEDLDAVMGTTPIPAADLPALLANHASDWPPYRRLTGKALRALLADLGVTVPSTGNRYPVDPVTIRNTLARRATADLDQDT